ncbi:MAG TPA: GEVED domain-containing protein, partial [Flavobacteriales bacterium]|nr:GEVED domain-containing protein [Flavobacteriales bacterium]
MSNTNANITLGRVQTPDMMSFVWTPPTCLQAASGLNMTGIGMSTATLNWSGTGNFDYAVGISTNVANATITGSSTGNSVNLSSLDAATVYYAWVRTNCGGGEYSQWAMTSFNTLPCVPTGSPSELTRVQLADIDNSSTGTSIFEDFTSIVGHVSSTLAYPITVTGNGQYYTAYAVAYFDWDHDGVYEDRQPIGTAATSPMGTVSGNVTISASGNGPTRMRIMWSAYYDNTNPCAIDWMGQAEDYTIDVAPLTCPPPTALTASNIAVHGATFSWTA